MTLSATTNERHREPVENRIDLILGLVIAAGLGLAPLVGVSDFQLSLLLEVMIFAILAMSLESDPGLCRAGIVRTCRVFRFGVLCRWGCSKQMVRRFGFRFRSVSRSPLLSPFQSAGCRSACQASTFLMITFAFAQMIYAVVYRWNSVTGGSDGLLIHGPTLLHESVLQSRQALYFFTLACFCLSFLAIQRIITSPFGRVLVGIRENTRRMRALGFNVRNYKLLAFTLAAAFAGLAGFINAQFTLFIAPKSAHWTQSGTVLVMVLIGGTRRHGRLDHRRRHSAAAAALAELVHGVLELGAGRVVHWADTCGLVKEFMGWPPGPSSC